MDSELMEFVESCVNSFEDRAADVTKVYQSMITSRTKRGSGICIKVENLPLVKSRKGSRPTRSIKDPFEKIAIHFIVSDGSNAVKCMAHNGLSLIPGGMSPKELSEALQLLTDSQRNGKQILISGSYQLHQGEKVFVVEQLRPQVDDKRSQLSSEDFEKFVKICQKLNTSPLAVMMHDDTLWRHVYAADSIKQAVLLNCLSPFKKQDMIHIAVITSMGEGKDHLIENIMQPLVPTGVASTGKLCTIPGLFGAMSGDDLNAVELGLIGKMNNERIAVSEFQTWSSEVFGELMNMLANGSYTMQKGNINVERDACLNMSFWGNPEKAFSNKMDKLAMLDVFKEYTFQMISRMTLIFAQMSLTFGDDNADKFVKRKIMDAMTGKFETPEAKAQLKTWRTFFREYLRYVSRMNPDMSDIEDFVWQEFGDIESSEEFDKVFLQRAERENRKFQQFINLCKGLARLNGDSVVNSHHLYQAKTLFNTSLQTLIKNVPLNVDLLEADGKIQQLFATLVRNSDSGQYDNYLEAKKRMNELGLSFTEDQKAQLIDMGVMDIVDGRVMLYDL